jgi:hypothetical protein
LIAAHNARSWLQALFTSLLKFPFAYLLVSITENEAFIWLLVLFLLKHWIIVLYQSFFECTTDVEWLQARLVITLYARSRVLFPSANETCQSISFKIYLAFNFSHCIIWEPNFRSPVNATNVTVPRGPSGFVLISNNDPFQVIAEVAC